MQQHHHGHAIQRRNIMKKTLVCMSAIALVSTLAACGREEAPGNEVVAENSMNTMMADANNPFAQSELTMDQSIAAAVGTNAGESWVRKMIAHHRGAIAMSQIVLASNPTADVAQMAQATIDKQGKEITQLGKLVATGTPDPASAEIYRPATTVMHNAMMAAKGADVAETYLRKMLEHHKGAVEMSNVALANGVTGAVRTAVSKTKTDQQMEIDMVEAMLRGEPMAMAPAAAPAAKPAAPTAKPAATATEPSKPATAKPAPAAKPKAPAPEPAADPHAGHDMNNMSH
jgi:uncharacterized protein (DUF305 family)